METACSGFLVNIFHRMIVGYEAELKESLCKVDGNRQTTKAELAAAVIKVEWRLPSVIPFDWKKAIRARECRNRRRLKTLFSRSGMTIPCEWPSTNPDMSPHVLIQRLL